MKIGIIVHSHTGNTLSVAERLKEKLLAKGHSVNMEVIKTVGVEQTKINDITKIQLENLPDTSIYDALIFGAPVRAASLSPVLAACLSKVVSLQNKKVACFVTEFFPFPWMGGNRAISQVKSICESKGGIVSGTGIVNWSRHRDKRIESVVEELSRVF